MVNREEKGIESNFENTKVLKDKNLLKMKQHEKCILFDNKDISKALNQMGLDICLLKHFNLMDYSLLFVIEWNPKYIELYPSEFERNKEGKVLFPIKLT